MPSSWKLPAPLALAVALVGCYVGGTSTSHDAALCMVPGGAVAGGADLHCDQSGTVQVTSASSCQPDGGMSMDMDGGMVVEAPPAPRFNTEGDDDDCKYHVSWAASSVCTGADVTFSVTVTQKADGQPATGAAPHVEALLTETHPAPNTSPQTTETSPGVYEIGPVRFDAAGMWTVRFHLYEECADTLPDSPHGHVAFYVDVPLGSPADSGATADGGGGCSGDLPSCPDSPPSYLSDVAPIVAARCGSCHSPGGVDASHDFTAWDGLYADRGTVLAQVYTCAMPPSPSPPLPADERTTLLTWLVCGAPGP